MPKKNNMITPYKKANLICDKAQYQEASFWEKLNLLVHLIRCGHCRNYTKNNKKLSKLIKSSNVKCMNKACKEAMKKEFNKALKEHSIN